MAPRRLASRYDELKAHCEGLAGQLGAKDEPELIRDYSHPLAYAAMLTLFGAPAKMVSVYEELFKAHSAALALTGWDFEVGLRYERALREFRRVLESVYRELAHEDNGTVIASFLHPPAGRSKLEPDEMFLVLKTFFAAAIENLILTIPMTLMALLQNPEQLAVVRDEPALAAAAYEEALRWNVPNHRNTRIVRADTELGGAVLRAGDRVTMLKGSANRDPSAWTEPDRFDLTRDQHEAEFGHISLGHGIHFCAGSGLARMLGPMALNVLIERFPNVKLLDGWQPSWQPVPLSRKLVALPLAL
jgi:cytochrome P450